MVMMTTKVKMARKSDGFGLADAKARLSELVERAQTEGPQQINRRDRPVAYLVSAAEWEHKTRSRGTLAEFFLNSPLRGSGVEIKRFEGEMRDLDL
jgi:prevent-host-death family protein